MADSRITDYTPTTVSSGNPIESSDENTNRTNIQTSVNDGNDVMVDLEKNYASGSTPTSVVTGKLWYDTTAKHGKIYDGSNWVTVAASGITVPVVFANTFQVSGAATFSSTVSISGAALNATFAAVFNTISVAGVAEFDGAVTVAGAAAFSSTVSVGGVASISDGVISGSTTYGDSTITQVSGAALNVVLASNSGDDFTVDTDKLVVSGDTGDIGMGTATPTAQLTVHSGASFLDFDPSSTTVKIKGMHAGSNTDLQFITALGGADTVNMTMRGNGGNVGIGEISPTARLHLAWDPTAASGQVMRPDSDTSGMSYIAFQLTSGSTIGSISRNASTSAVLYNVTSDVRLKENITDLNNALNILTQIQPRNFTWKSDTSGFVDIGFIAQEIANVLPGMVNVPEDTDEMWGVDYGRMTPLLTKAIQEQQETIDAQQKQINGLLARVTALEGG